MTVPHRFPTSEEYTKVFVTSTHWLQKPQRKLLEAHLRSPAHTVTASTLAEQMGYDTYSAVNMLYGNLASAVSKRLKKLGVPWEVPTGEPASSSLVVFEREGSEAHWRWVMRPELVEALVALGWK